MAYPLLALLAVGTCVAAEDDSGDYVRRMVSWGWGRRSHFPDWRPPSVAAFPFAPATADWWIAVEPLVMRDEVADAHAGTRAGAPDEAVPHGDTAADPIGPGGAQKVIALRGGGSVNRGVMIGGGDDDDETPSHRTVRAGTAHYIGRDAARAVRETRDRPLSVIIHNTSPASADWFRAGALTAGADDSDDSADRDDRHRTSDSAQPHSDPKQPFERKADTESEAISEAKSEAKSEFEAKRDDTGTDSDRERKPERSGGGGGGDGDNSAAAKRSSDRNGATQPPASHKPQRERERLTVSFAVPRDGSVRDARVALDRHTLRALRRARGRGVMTAVRAMRQLRLLQRGGQFIAVTPAVWVMRGDAEPRFSVTAESMRRGDGDHRDGDGDGDTQWQRNTNADASSGGAKRVISSASRAYASDTSDSSEGQIGRRSSRDRDRSSERGGGYLRRQVSWSWNAPTDDAPGGFVADAW